jgi:hypothetical protein
VARNRLRNLYITVGIPKDSHLYHALCTDASETGLSLAQLATVRLADWYRHGATSSSTHHDDALAGQSCTPAEADSSVTQEAELQQRAAAAAAAWLLDDE